MHKQYRLRGYDYSSEGFYFITAVTKNREPYFGEITDGTMHFHSIGQHAFELLQKFKPSENADHPFQNNPLLKGVPDKILYLPEFIVMPNHIHLILGIAVSPGAGTDDALCLDTSLRPLQKNSVSAFMNHYKGKITRHAIETNSLPFGWQPRFNDRVIRNAAEYERIAWYIRNNVANWATDEESRPKL